ncbi:MAG: N-acetylmuramoyl-L-alanine amidase [Candidatus Yanofskybacteria bacterium]|nr:N-acetylmuramoyl-L-alanine amidase [Candidatus Yanofskybacteria bacterium]
MEEEKKAAPGSTSSQQNSVPQEPATQPAAVPQAPSLAQTPSAPRVRPEETSPPVKTQNTETPVPVRTPEKPREEKQEFLQREEVRTMEKDLARLRSQEAQRERERIASLKQQGRPATPKPDSVAATQPQRPPQPVLERPAAPKRTPTALPIQEERGSQKPPAYPARTDLRQPASPPGPTQSVQDRAPSAPSPTKKVLVRLLILTSILSISGLVAFFGYQYLTQEVPFAQEPIAQEEEEPVLEPEPEPAPEQEQEPAIPQDPIFFDIVERPVSWGYASVSSPRPITSIILHSAYHAAPGANPYDTEALLSTFRQFNVSYHYLINRQGTILRLVSDNNVAYHAKNGINASSLGIGLLYQESETPNTEQYQALAFLLSQLQAQYQIPAEQVKGYSQVNAEKNTPWNFDLANVLQ